jgi:hypothetical protein
MPHTHALTAFCSICPNPEEVTTILSGLGFRLIFQMDAILYPASSEAPDLPAQYHFADQHGTEVIYLAGTDAAMDGESFPKHQSRWWLYPGADAGASRQIISMLTTRWLLTWQRIDSVSTQGIEHVA